MKSAVSGRNNMGPMQGFLFFDRLGRREAAGAQSGAGSSRNKNLPEIIN